MEDKIIHPLEYHNFPDLPAELIEAVDTLKQQGMEMRICRKADGSYSLIGDPVFSDDPSF